MNFDPFRSALFMFMVVIVIAVTAVDPVAGQTGRASGPAGWGRTW